MATARFEADLIRRYDVNGPRYTSYPTANLFEDGDFQRPLEQAFAALPDDAPLSVYLHVPFCSTICFYCACNKINTGNHKHADAYLERLIREMDLRAPSLPPAHTVQQLHFGGGTPTFLTDAQFSRLFAALDRHFNLVTNDARDYSIEVDPRKLAPARIAHLGSLGLNRMSVGIQDFDPEVQHAVNRIQSEAETATVIEAARDNGFGSISVDLIYGLPHQTPDGFARTLEKVLALGPDRLSMYSYAHLPMRFKTQRQIAAEHLPDAETKLSLLERAVSILSSAGYDYVGMDHFAKANDGLIRAQIDGTLQRNFMGYTTHGQCELIGLGVSAISDVGNVYCQNSKSLTDYYAQVDSGQIPIERGLAASRGDLVTRDVIQKLMCHFRLDFAEFENRHGENFRAWCGERWDSLETMQRQGLLELCPESLTVSPRGRFLIRNVCMTFDDYLPQNTTRFSKAI